MNQSLGTCPNFGVHFTGLSPKSFVAEDDGHAFLCQCKHTGDAPYCDGTHEQFDKDQVGTEGPD
ncbi:CDGSH iron-sulfur domain-containing protein [Marinobacter segnicrescens]|uniref:CDGSH iron-sulfur domain-containing protein n=1 Tax=Marinobacter segnicrescens TaxID=430453 RepID=UPI001FE0C354|nr:CDGSH iron-sulfur domain-containing protein [Marinobacter segnicrescens]